MSVQGMQILNITSLAVFKSIMAESHVWLRNTKRNLIMNPKKKKIICKVWFLQHIYGKTFVIDHTKEETHHGK